jgi:hypothetical protein
MADAAWSKGVLSSLTGLVWFSCGQPSDESLGYFLASLLDWDSCSGRMEMDSEVLLGTIGAEGNGFRSPDKDDR